MFDAIINKKIDTRGYDFDLIIADVEQLNQMAFNSESDITKISYHGFFKSIANYQMLNSGGALGKNCGPLIISKKKIYPDELHDCKIAIPGENTTAKLLMDIFFPNIKEYKNYLFSDIEEAVLQNECDAGLVIHETRFVYKEKGLKLNSITKNSVRYIFGKEVSRIVYPQVEDIMPTDSGAEFSKSVENVMLDEIAEKTGYSLASISNKMKILANIGLIKKTRKPFKTIIRMMP
jgi:hypothetical protein